VKTEETHEGPRKRAFGFSGDGIHRAGPCENPRMPVLLALQAVEADESALPPLSDQDRERLSHLLAPLRRQQFLAGRRLLQELAARFTGTPDRAWLLCREADGKRRLYTTEGQAGPYASISHDGRWVTAAVGQVPLGLDLTLRQRERDWPRIARGMFAPQVADALERLPDDRQQHDFCQHWALLEAWSKRSGRGLQRSLSRSLLARACPAGEAEAWTWPVAGGFLALAAAAGSRPEGLAEAPEGGWRYCSLA